ncbi:MAG: flagella basal body P-ring formation protein FlgA [Fimbriimonadaceae bacterium]|nr:flagella basal body P-ring formation protein FlgA [Fimbriimonadaceae bacterium]
MLSPVLLALIAGVAPRVSVRVDGDGFFRFLQGGRLVYAREAELTVADGRLCGGSERWVSPTISIAANATRLEVEADGRVFVLVAGGKTAVGRLALALYPETSVKTRQGDVWAFQDRPTLAYPGEGGAGRVVSGVAKSVAPAALATDPAPKPSATATVTVRDDFASDDGPVTLGRIATIEGDPALAAKLRDVELIATPPFRTRATISRIGIEQKVRAAGVDPKRLTIKMGSYATVRRTSQMLTQSAITEEAKKALASQGAPLESLLLESPPAELEAPTGDLRMETQVAVTGLAYTVTIAVWHGTNRIGVRSLRYEPALAAIGVRSGDPVQLVLRSAGARVTCAAKATHDALLGGEATVRLETGKTHRGRVVARGVVEVTL